MGWLVLVLVLVLVVVQLEGIKGLHLYMGSKFVSRHNPVFVAGGSSGLGLDVVRGLSALSIPVRALTRTVDAFENLRGIPHVFPFLGDAMDADAVQKCMEGCTAAVSTLGGKPPVTGDSTERLSRVDYVGNSNVVEQAGILGVERIVLVTSIGCGSSEVALDSATFSALKEALFAKTEAEKELKMYTNLDWTIVRPGRLTNDAASGCAELASDVTTRGSISRADCASLIVQVLLNRDGVFTRRAVSAVDKSRQ